MEVKVYNDKTQNSRKELTENKHININPPASSNLLNNPLDFSTIQSPLEELAESKSAIIHIKNTCKNSFFNCYVNCCFGHSVIFNTFLNTPKGIKYLFQNNATINPDPYNCTFKENIKLQARFTSLIKSNPQEITLDTGNPFTEMLKTEKFCCCDKEEILMPVNIIAENRIAGIVKIHGLPSENCYCNKACLFLPCCWTTISCLFFLSCCCPFCSFECGDCGKSDKESSGCCNCNICNSDEKSGDCCKCDCCNSDKKCPCCDENRCCCGLCEKSKSPCCCCCCCCCCDPKVMIMLIMIVQMLNVVGISSAIIARFYLLIES